MKLTLTPPRVWAFDVEAAPSAWGGADFTYKRLICAASGRPGAVPHYLAPDFSAAFAEAFFAPLRDPNTLVVAHNANYDLDLANGTLVKLGLAPLGPVLVSDTMRHLPRNGYAYSRRLGDMCKRFGVARKGEMDPYDWEQVRENDPAALRRLRDYNIGDVRCTLELREVLLARGLLGPPRMWRPEAR